MKWHNRTWTWRSHWGRIVNIVDRRVDRKRRPIQLRGRQETGLIGFTVDGSRYGSLAHHVQRGSARPTRTELTAGSLTDEMVGELVKLTPIKREGTADDIAAVAFLCAERAGFITGR